MIEDYEITRKKTILEKLLPYLEFVIVLLIIQSIITLFTGGAEEEDAIRFRLLAHSDAPVDQQIKRDIQQEIEPLIAKAVADSQTNQELVDNLAAIEETILEVAGSLSNGHVVTLERKDALFPPKRSGLFIHPQAAYDAYILTIGSGRGDNWWCALFPKICFPDQKEEQEEEGEEEVTFFVWEWIKTWFS